MTVNSPTDSDCISAVNQKLLLINSEILINQKFPSVTHNIENTELSANFPLRFKEDSYTHTHIQSCN